MTSPNSVAHPTIEERIRAELAGTPQKGRKMDEPIVCLTPTRGRMIQYLQKVVGTSLCCAPTVLLCDCEQELICHRPTPQTIC